MGSYNDKALTTHANKDRGKREDHPHRRPRIFQKNHRSQRDYSNIRCFTCDDKCHFVKYCPETNNPLRQTIRRGIMHILLKMMNQQEK